MLDFYGQFDLNVSSLSKIYELNKSTKLFALKYVNWLTNFDEHTKNVKCKKKSAEVLSKADYPVFAFPFSEVTVVSRCEA